MSDDLSFLQPVAETLLEIIAPLQTALANPGAFEQLLAAHGWEVSPGSVTATDITQAFGAGQAIAAIGSDVAKLEQGDGGTDEVGVYADLVTQISNLIYQLGMMIHNAPQALPFPFNQEDFWTEFPPELVDDLFISYLRGHHPTIFAWLYGIGLIDEQLKQAGSAVGRVDYTLRSIQWHRIPEIISPATLLRDVYGWGSGNLDWQKVLGRLGLLLDNLGLLSQQIPADPTEAAPYWGGAPPAGLECLRFTIAAGEVSDTVVYALGLVILPIPGAGGSMPGLAIYPELVGSLPALTFAETSLDVSGQFAVSGGIVLELRPSGTNVSTTAAGSSLGEHLKFTYAPASPLIFFGTTDGTHLSAQSVTGGLSVEGALSTPDIDLTLQAKGMELVIGGGDGDGFLTSMLGSGDATISLAFSLGWSSQRGVHLGDGASLETTIPVNVKILAADIQSVTAGMAANAGGLVLTFGVTAQVTLGPLIGTIQGVGLEAQLVPAPPGKAGILGQYDLSFGFRPPEGVALAIDAPGVSGVGFIAFDETNARYLGALALAVGDVSISAVGVLDTRLPDGEKGYSLVVVASATFLPIELGFGFSLAGIGGLVGVNRTVDVPSLQALARAGRLDDLMFPADLIHRAPQVAANLAQVFPPAQGHFIVGPAVRIEWGAEGMVDAEIGVFIELSDSGGGINLLRVALLGWLHLSLPDPIEPVADLKLDVLGLVDIPGKMLSLDAGLRDSTIADFPLTGQAAMRASWGANAAFVLAMGGFNPAFAAPAGFPALQRLTLAIGGDNPRLTLSAYLALTSNTLQLGCSADLYASIGTSVGTAAVSASLTFDALVQFKPFGLIVDLTIAATVLLDGNAIMTLNLDLHVTGPNPWTATGSAHFHALFCDVTIPISIPAGPQPPPQQPQTVDLDGNLAAALADLHSWQTGPPAGRGVVTVRGQDAAHPAVHPLGSLTVRQHAVPLGQRIVRYGPDLVDACQYDITSATLGGLDAPTAAVTDSFAPAQFLKMDDAAKLSSPSFEPMTAGVTLGSPQLTLPAAPGSAKGSMTVVDTRSTSDWNMLTLDSPDPSGAPAATAPVPPAVVAAPGTVALPDTLLQSQLPGAAAAVNGPGGHGAARYSGAGGSGIALKEPSYAVVGMNLAGIGADPGRCMLIPTTAAAPSRAPAGVSGTDWQVVYTSEMAGPGGMG
jgi:hypothetical protein